MCSSEGIAMAADFRFPGDYTGVRGANSRWVVLPDYSRSAVANGIDCKLFFDLIFSRRLLARLEACKVDRMTTIESVRRLAETLPRSYEVLVRDRVKFRVGQIVYLAFSRDEETMGFAFPKEERDALVAAEPAKFLMPDRSDLRFNWVVVRLAAIDDAEMRELVIDAWKMVVPKKVSAARLAES